MGSERSKNNAVTLHTTDDKGKRITYYWILYCMADILGRLNMLLRRLKNCNKRWESKNRTVMKRLASMDVTMMVAAMVMMACFTVGPLSLSSSSSTAGGGFGDVFVMAFINTRPIPPSPIRSNTRKTATRVTVSYEASFRRRGRSSAASASSSSSSSSTCLWSTKNYLDSLSSSPPPEDDPSESSPPPPPTYPWQNVPPPPPAFVNTNDRDPSSQQGLNPNSDSNINNNSINERSRPYGEGTTISSTKRRTNKKSHNLYLKRNTNNNVGGGSSSGGLVQPMRTSKYKTTIGCETYRQKESDFCRENSNVNEL